MPESYSLPERWPAGRRVSERWKCLPRKLRLGALIGCALSCALVASMVLVQFPSTLNVVCRHNLRSAELSVLIDGDTAHSEQITGAARKRFGLFDTRIEGAYSRSLAVPAGHHTVQVRLRSLSDGFEQTRTVGVNLVAGKDATVLASTQRGSMSLTYQGPPVASDETSSGYFRSLRALLVTALGSAASAAIAFVVQEALRARKHPSPAQSQNS